MHLLQRAGRDFSRRRRWKSGHAREREKLVLILSACISCCLLGSRFFQMFSNLLWICPRYLKFIYFSHAWLALLLGFRHVYGPKNSNKSQKKTSIPFPSQIVCETRRSSQIPDTVISIAERWITRKPNMRQGPNKAMIGVVFITNRSNQKLFVEYSHCESGGPERGSK